MRPLQFDVEPRTRLADPLFKFPDDICSARNFIRQITRSARGRGDSAEKCGQINRVRMYSLDAACFSKCPLPLFFCENARSNRQKTRQYFEEVKSCLLGGQYKCYLQKRRLEGGSSNLEVSIHWRDSKRKVQQNDLQRALPKQNKTGTCPFPERQ